MELPTPISDELEYCLSLSISKVKTIPEIHIHLDMVASAQANLNTQRLEFSFALAHIQAESRAVERTVRTDNAGEKVTAQTRKLKTDTAYVNHNKNAELLTALIAYCDTAQNLLESKAFNLRMLLKERHA